MDTIKTYLNNMFQAFPDTPEVRRAREELLQMMEDKYTELKAEGKTENEAVGIVISEFGNIDELIEDFGLQNVVKDNKETETYTGKWMNTEEAKSCLKAFQKRALMIAFGVMLCILSPVSTIVCDGLQRGNTNTPLEGIGVCIMFCFIALAVILFILSSGVTREWTQESCRPDTQAKEYLRKEKKKKSGLYQIILSIGIACCILSVLPPIIVDSLNLGNFWDELSGGMFLSVIAFSVFLIVYSACMRENYQHLLHGTKVGKIDKEEPYEFSDPRSKTISSIYWNTVTCIYLCWSFLSFDWHITWIIWPVASIFFGILKIALGEPDQEV